MRDAGGGPVSSHVVDVHPSASIRRRAKTMLQCMEAHAQPGEHVTVEVPLDKRAFQYWSVEQHGWVEETGTFQVYAGQNVADTPLHTQVAR